MRALQWTPHCFEPLVPPPLVRRPEFGSLPRLCLNFPWLWEGLPDSTPRADAGRDGLPPLPAISSSFYSVLLSREHFHLVLLPGL